MATTRKFQHSVKWSKMDIQTPPNECGVYAIKNKKEWMYIGKSICISTRIKSKWHPIQITQNLDSLCLSYFWCPVPKNILARTENALIRELSPPWNGSTSFEHYGNESGPTCYNSLPLTPEQMKSFWGDDD